jgi:hypothetical protein
MWSSPVALYPSHLASVIAPCGQAQVIEPQVSKRTEYLVVQLIKGPYEMQQYSRRLWVC